MFVRDRGRYERLLAEIVGIEREWEEAGGVGELGEPEVVDITRSTDEEEDDYEEEPPGPNVPNYPRTEVADAVDNALDGFQASITDDVEKTLRQILNRLEVLTEDGGQLEQALQSEHSQGVRAALAEIVAWAEQHRELLG
jgi:hypothetical protein